MANHVSLGTTAEMKGFVDGLKANDCRIEADGVAGTICVYDGEKRVFSAIEKGRGGPWIMLFRDSDRITWSKPT